MLISVYAWVVMILSMPLMLMTSKMGMRKLLFGVVAVFTSFQVMSYLSTSFGMLMVSRIGVACAHSIFWSIVSIIAVRISSGESSAHSPKYDSHRIINSDDSRPATRTRHRAHRGLANYVPEHSVQSHYCVRISVHIAPEGAEAEAV